MQPPREAVEAFAADIAQAANERGVVLTPDQVNRVYAQTLATGTFHPDGTRHALNGLLSDPGEVEPAFTEDYDDVEDDDPAPLGDEFEDMLSRFVEPATQRVAERAGRPLTLREQAQLREAAEESARGGALNHDEIAERAGVKPFEDMSRTEQARVMAERVRDQAPDPDEGRVYDLREMSSKDWNDYMVDRVQGIGFEDADDPFAVVED